MKNRTDRILDWVIGILAGMVILGLIFAVTTSAHADEYPSDSVGRLLYSYTNDFTGGFITGFANAMVVTGLTCPGIVTGAIVKAALAAEVQAGRVALTDRDTHGIIKAINSLGCTHPQGKKSTQPTSKVGV